MSLCLANPIQFWITRKKVRNVSYKHNFENKSHNCELKIHNYLIFDPVAETGFHNDVLSALIFLKETIQNMSEAF